MGRQASMERRVTGAGDDASIVATVRTRANWMRRRSIRMVFEAGLGNPGG